MRLCIHGNMTWSLSFDTRTSAEPPRTWRCVIHQQMHVQCTNTEYKYIHLYKEYTCCTKITHSCANVRCCTKVHTVVQMYTVVQRYTVVQITQLYKGAHSCTKVHTVVQRCIQLYKDVHSCTNVHRYTNVHSCTKVHTFVQRCSQLYNMTT